MEEAHVDFPQPAKQERYVPPTLTSLGTYSELVLAASIPINPITGTFFDESEDLF